MARWVKVPHKFEAVFSLEKYQGARSITYRYRYRKDGLELEGTIPGREKRSGEELAIKDIASIADKEITKRRNETAPKPKSLVRSADLCDEIVQLRKTKSPATYEQTEIFFRKHIKPYLIDNCPYAENLNPTVWDNYKNFKRMENASVALFNHFKFFLMLFRYAHQKGVLPTKYKLDFDEKKEDFRAKGHVIPDELFRAFLKAADSEWRARAICQRLTGQRPGIYQRLRKERVNFETGAIKVIKADSKNRREYSFIAPKIVLRILKFRVAGESPFFFPNPRDPKKAVGRGLKGWHSAWERARDNLFARARELEADGKLEDAKKARLFASAIRLGDDPFTPHDLRHGFLSYKFKNSKNPALVCYQCDLSLEEAMRTYIHFGAEDTQLLADEADLEAGKLLKWGSGLAAKSSLK